MIVGVLACLTASFTLGSVFAPIKKFPSSDGFMVQFFMSLGGFLTSLAIHALLDFPPIYPLAMLGGALWCIANAFAFLIMNRLGLAVPILIWSTVSCLTGWATSRYGLFGVPKGVPSSVILNYFGVVVLVIGSSFFLFIKTKVYKPKNSEKLASGGEIPSEKSMATQTSEENDIVQHPHHVSPVIRIVCFLAAIFSGLFYGSMCTPVTFIQNRQDLFPGAPTQGLPYLFSFFLGIMPTSTLVLAVYSGVKKNSPSLPPYLVLPSLLAGLLFAIGMGGFFIGNEKLSQTISYPICSFAPGLVVSAWSVLYFKEITGKRNMILLAIAYAFTLVGVIMVTISKDL
uniref:Transmembrane protein 144 n=1 Tax=Caenorhabditis tropicalis TaxID=1561998 RepID=A0A1I7U492_9PELO